MKDNDIIVVASVGTIYVNGNKYSMVTEYRHYTKERDGEVHGGCLQRRTDAVDIIDVTMPVFCEELNNLKYGSTLKYVGKVFKGKTWELGEMIPIGVTEETYLIERSQFFIKNPVLYDIGTVTYRFYVSEIDYSSYRSINNNAEKE